MSDRKKYVLVGTGGRASMFINATAGSHREHCKLLAFCDLSQTRMDFWNRHIQSEHKHPAVATYHADDFDRMIAEVKPDTVIVTTMDSTHHTYVIRAVELGCDVICEKPMTTDAKKAQAILDAVERTGQKVDVTFNFRYTPKVTMLRDVIRSGKIGTPLAVDVQWVLNTSHGADYFRRWHREKSKSGGLLIHKSTHHFDMVNFWLDSFPKSVFAMGDLKFYGKEAAEKRGESYDYARYSDCPDPSKDPFHCDLDENPKLQGLYRDAEADSGYIRDQNVFGEGITIEDTMAVIARYRSGVQLSYSLLAYSPWEGLRACVTGTKGRVELFETHGSHIIAGQSDEELAEQQMAEPTDVPGLGNFVVYYPMFGQPTQLEVPRAEGSHGGGDPLILQQLLDPDAPPDPFGREADHIDGAASLLLGLAANRSIETGQMIDVDQLLRLPE